MPRYVVQLHDATTLHHDFRLEVDGVLKSWAVPKGPSTDPAEKRLAVQVPDHALSHADYESAKVEIVDAGTWEPITEGDPAAALADGHLSFRLDGRTFTGAWTLHRTRAGDKPQWLLIRRRDVSSRR
jgi:DNA ligase D-like protein (predicted 3'-phosphoesterase)